MNVKDHKQLSITTLLYALGILFFLPLPSGSLFCYGQQAPTSVDIDRGRVMLRTVRDDLKKNYYDPTYHGMDVEARFKAADDKIKQAASIAQIFGIIAQALVDLDDSHTFFYPPERSYRTEYGWQMKMIGDKCYVVAVKPGSDAETKGLKEGDQIYAMDGSGPTRENMWKIQYAYNALRPRPGMHLFVIKPDEDRQEFDVLAKITQGKKVMDLTDAEEFNDTGDLVRRAENESRLRRHRYVEMGDDLFIWKMPAFDLQGPKVDEMMGRFRKRKSLILDLRGNGGGFETTLLRLLGNVLDHDAKLGDVKRRKETKQVMAKTPGNDCFAGKIIVLIDSQSGSAAELFARVMQLEKRATIIGDRSAGAVMRSMYYQHQTGLEVIVPYGVSITDADIIMTDGKSLEHVGVTPDEIKLPTAADLAAKRDPVLAYAASLLGVTISSEKAGALFPIEWMK